jgi:hypothetical protein
MRPCWPSLVLLLGCSPRPLTTPGVDGAADSRGSQADARPASLDARPGPDATEATVVWPADATRLVAEVRSFGFGPPPPPTSICPLPARYTFTAASGLLEWGECQIGPPAAFNEGQRTLTPGQQEPILQALRGLEPSNPNACGADKGVEALVVTTPAGEKTYLDGFYACQKMGVYVDGIDAVLLALRLAR